MRRSPSIYILFCLLPGFASLSFPPNPCIIPTAVGEFNLTSLGVLRFTEPGSNWLYVFSPCADVDPAPLSGLCGSAAPGPAFQVTMGDCLRLGKLKTRNGTALPGPRIGVSVAYSDGDGGRLSALELVCGDGPTVLLGLIAGRQPRQYLLEARGLEGCPRCPRDPHSGSECGGDRGRCYKNGLGAFSCACISGHGGPYCASIQAEHRDAYKVFYAAFFCSIAGIVYYFSRPRFFAASALESTFPQSHVKNDRQEENIRRYECGPKYTFSLLLMLPVAAFASLGLMHPSPATSFGTRAARTAVCVSGQLRTLTMKPDHPMYPEAWAYSGRQNPPVADLQGMTVAETIQKRFFPSLGELDVFVVIGTKEGPKEPRAGDLGACEPLRPAGKPNSHLHCDVYREVDLPVWGPVWSSYSQHGLEQSLLQQLYGMWRCSEAVRNHERLTDTRYDYMVRLRPDVAFFAPALAPIESLDFGTPEAPKVLIAARSSCCCGNEDWFNAGERGVMMHLMDRFLFLQSLPQPFRLGWTAENYASITLDEVGGTLTEEPRLPACVLKPKDRTWPGQPRVMVGAAGSAL